MYLVCTTVYTMSLYVELQCTLCHYVATMYSVSLCSYNVHCVTMQLQCTLCHYIYVATQCHYIATVYTVSLCSYSAHNVNMQLQYIYTVSLCIRYIVATVYTLSLCSCSVSLYQLQCMCHVSLCSQLHCVTMQLQCTHCHYVATVYTVSLDIYMWLQCTLYHYVATLCHYVATVHVQSHQLAMYSQSVAKPCYHVANQLHAVYVQLQCHAVFISELLQVKFPYRILRSH